MQLFISEKVSPEKQRLRLKKEVEDLAVYLDVIQDIQRTQSLELHFWLAEIRKAVTVVDKHLVVLTADQSDGLDDTARDFHIHQVHYEQQKIVEIYNDIEGSMEVFDTEQKHHVLKIVADISTAVEQLIPV